MKTSVVFASLLVAAQGWNNGKARTPPLGFRNWNQYQRNIDQPTMEAIMDAMVDRSRTVNGKPTSLADLGYTDVGLDDAWQQCGAYGPNGTYHYHDINGNPIVNTTRFPSMRSMVDYAHSLNLTAGWYMNNCICAEKAQNDAFYVGDVNALVAAGFDSVKLDGCGTEYDLQRWADLITAQSPEPVLVENCHWGWTLPNASWCPFNYYRTSTDARPTFGSVLNNLYSVPPLAAQNLSTPGCWAYPDMIETGVTNTQSSAPPLSYVEGRTNFGAWAILSSPLIIGLNVTDGPTVDSVWDIITNTELIAVNQAWAGFAGTMFADAGNNDNRTFTPCTWVSDTCSFPAWQMLYKPLPNGQTAIMIINSDTVTTSLTVDWSQVPGLTAGAAYKVRDLYAHADLGVFTGSYTAVGLTPHDSAFIVVSKP